MEYIVKTLGADNYRVEAVKSGELVAFGWFYVEGGKAFGKTFWHKNETLQPMIIVGILQKGLEFIGMLGIGTLNIPPVMNTAILAAIADNFPNSVFIQNDIKIAPSFGYKVSNYNCSTGIQDLLPEERVSVMLPAQEVEK